MAVLICGSMAHDTIMIFKDRFQNHILPEQSACPQCVVSGSRNAQGIRRMCGQYRL